MTKFYRTEFYLLSIFIEKKKKLKSSPRDLNIVGTYREVSIDGLYLTSSTEIATIVFYGRHGWTVLRPAWKVLRASELLIHERQQTIAHGNLFNLGCCATLFFSLGVSSYKTRECSQTLKLKLRGASGHEKEANLQHLRTTVNFTLIQDDEEAG